MATEKQSVSKQQTAQKVKAMRARRRSARQPLAPNKLMLLVTVVPRKKAEYYLDLIHSFEANLQLEVSAFGTATKSLGFIESDIEKQALFSVIRQDQAPKIMSTLSQKFATIRGGKGIAFTIPLTSTVGVSVYQFLSNKQ